MTDHPSSHESLLSSQYQLRISMYSAVCNKTLSYNPLPAEMLLFGFKNLVGQKVKIWIL